MKQNIDYSVVVPVFNGVKYLKILHHRLSKTLSQITSKYEIIFIDDYSSDHSWKLLQELKKIDKRTKIVQLSKNYGQHNATLCGIRLSQGRYVVTLDQDLQHPPEEIPKLISKIKEGYQLVYGQYEKKRHSWFRNFGSRLTNIIISDLTGSQRNITSFRIIDREVIKHLNELNNPNIIIDILFSYVVPNREIGFCKVKHSSSRGKSNYNLFKLINISLNMVFNHTTIPLRLASMAGFTLSIISILGGLFYTSMYFSGHIKVQGFTATILALLFLFGITLLVLGIIGEYIGKIFLIVNKKPQYVIKKIGK